MFKIIGKVFENGNYIGKTVYVLDLDKLEMLIDVMDFDIANGRYLKIYYVEDKD